MNVFRKIRIIHNCRKEIILDIKKKIDLIAFQKEWRIMNPDNGTVAVNRFDPNIVKVGEGTYGNLNIIGFGNPEEKLTIGRYCSIAGNVTFLLGGEHPLDLITTYPYALHILKRDDVDPTPTKGAIVIEDDVWLCHNSLILSGVTVGKGSVIGAGAIVTKDVPPYSIYVNGKVVRKRFEDDVVEWLVSLDLDRIKRMDGEKQEWLMQNPVNSENINKIRGWFDSV